MSEPILFYNSRFRQYRFRIRDNVFMKVKAKIRNAKELKALIEQYKPIDVYQTVAWWLNPNTLGPKRIKKAGYRILNNFFLGSDYIMDFDLKDYASEEEMVDNLCRARLLLERMGMKEHTVIKTGKGRQLLVTDFDKWVKLSIGNPMDREYAYGFKMKLLTETMMKSGIKWDDKVSTDTRRIFRTPGTLHQNGNTIKILETTSPKAMML